MKTHEQACLLRISVAAYHEPFSCSINSRIMGCAPSKPHRGALSTTLLRDAPTAHDLVTNALESHTPINLTANAPQRDVRFNEDAYFCSSTRGELAAMLRSKCQDVLASNGDVSARLRTVGSRITMTSECYNALPFDVFEAVPTAAELTVTQELGVLAESLTQNRFAKAASAHSWVIIGPRGDGKSVALERFAVTAPVVLPSLRVVYVNASRIHNSGHAAHGGLATLLRGLDLGPQLESQLAFSSDIDSQTTLGQFPLLVRELRAWNLYLMVIIDEAEVLYQSPSPQARALIDEVHHFATTTSGRTSIVLCSSSCFMYALVKGGMAVPTALHGVFKALCPTEPSPALPDMNADKLGLVHVASFNPMSVHELTSLYSSKASDGERRAVAFFVGNHVRRTYERQMIKPLIAPMRLLTGQMASRGAGTLVPALLREYKDTTSFLGMLYNELYIRNKRILDGVLDAGADGLELLHRVNLAKVKATDWLGAFVPLSASDVRGVWQRSVESSMMDDTAAMEIVLDFLRFDMALIARLHDGSVFPTSAYSVLLHNEDCATRVVSSRTAGQDCGGHSTQGAAGGAAASTQ